MRRQSADEREEQRTGTVSVRSLTPPSRVAGAAHCGGCCRRHETKHAPPDQYSEVSPASDAVLAEPGQHTLPSATAGRSERFAEDCASRGAKLGKQAADTMLLCPRARSARCSQASRRRRRAVLRRPVRAGRRFERRDGWPGTATFERRERLSRARGQREGRRPRRPTTSDGGPVPGALAPRHERRRPRAAHDFRTGEPSPGARSNPLSAQR